MIKKYRFGEPFETGAVLEQKKAEDAELTFFQVKQGEKLSFFKALEETDRIYGLGENVRGINKRGWIYKSECNDVPIHREDTRSLYGAHNFFVIEGKVKTGIFFDTPSAITFDMGYTEYGSILIESEEPDLDVYIIEGGSILDIVGEFRRIIGRSYIPPKWAFGYQQSRWGYRDEKDIREVVREHRSNHIPLDAVYMDIDYMESYKDFSIDKSRFPDLKGLVQEMKEEHIHLVPIIDAGVKIEPGYQVYEEGCEKGYFCKEEDGTEFVAGVWPGQVHFPDFLNPDAGRWFGEHYRCLLDCGIDGFWNDMNEPAIFYSQKRLEKVFAKFGAYQGENLDTHAFFKYLEAVNGLGGNSDDYKQFYHQTPMGRIRHDKVHNIYGYKMTEAAADAFKRYAPERRTLMFSRASYIGMHRCSGIWQGDNLSWWSHLLLNIQMMPSLNMCGFLYTGADIGGFGSDTTEDLLLRWLAFGIFTPLMRNHASAGTREQEVYRFGNQNAFRNIIGIRYGLIPYLYSEFVKCAGDNRMMFMPLSFVFGKDERTYDIEDQLLVGDSLMIAPVYTQNANGRFVYLPEDMVMVRMKSLKEKTLEKMKQGDHYIKVAADEVVFFIRKNKMLPLSCGGESINEIDENRFELLAGASWDSAYELYRDDGYSSEIREDGIIIVNIDKRGSVEMHGADVPEVKVLLAD